jgi:DNA-binding transcriptional MerR regulator
MTADAAAALLGTSPTILSLWEERFGYPVPVPSRDGQRLYPDEMMIALRDALSRELSITSAITQARRLQRLGGSADARGSFAWPHEDPEEAR